MPSDRARVAVAAGGPVKLPAPRRPSDEDASLLMPVATLVVWLGCVAAGVAGLALPYPRPVAAAKPPPPALVAQVIQAELARSIVAPTEAPSPDAPPPPQPIEAPPSPPPPAAAPPAAPPQVAVATPAVAFPLPVEAPATTVDPRIADSSRPATKPATIPPSPAIAASGPPPGPQKMILGQGEGQQIHPEYPREAQLARQEGTVVIRFTIGQNGRVLNAEAAVPCPFPMLNQAALRAVREARFDSGPARLREISIVFERRR